jgi:hypothetical protein
MKAPSFLFPRKVLAAVAVLFLLHQPRAFALYLGLTQCYQEKDQWCWAAVSQSILAFYGTNVTQSNIAQYAKSGANVSDCLYGLDQGVTTCIDGILSNFMNITSTGDPRSLSLSEAQSEIDTNGRPLVVNWYWSNGGGHYVVMHGLTNTLSDTYAYLMDPYLGPVIMTYSWVVSGSTNSEDSGYLHTWEYSLRLTTNPGTISVSPTSIDFGPVVLGSHSDQSFEVDNDGDGMLVGSASVPAPFSVVAGSPYRLAGRSGSLVTIRYTPLVGQQDVQTVSFTGGGLATRQVSGSGSATVSGQILTTTGHPLAGAVVSFSDVSDAAPTDLKGYYTNAVPHGWTGTAAPSLTGYRFSPMSRGYTNVTANVTGQDYTAAVLDYTITCIPSTIDGGGGRRISASYVNDGSVGGIAGLSTVALPSETAKHGYVAQLGDVVGLSITATPPSVNEGGSSQLSGTATLDDGTVTMLAGSEVTWGAPAWPIAGINAGGVATTAAVYADTPGTVSGRYFGVPGSGSLVVLDSDPDNYGSYAHDGLPDWWQVRYFGLNNPNAAPGVDADGDGQSNYFEYITGTDPTNAASFFQFWIESVAGQPDQKKLTFMPWASGRTYTPEYRTNLVLGAYTNLTDYGSPQTNDTKASITDTNATEQTKFYRIKITYP